MGGSWEGSFGGETRMRGVLMYMSDFGKSSIATYSPLCLQTVRLRWSDTRVDGSALANAVLTMHLKSTANLVRFGGVMREKSSPW